MLELGVGKSALLDAGGAALAVTTSPPPPPPRQPATSASARTTASSALYTRGDTIAEPVGVRGYLKFRR